MRLWGSLSKCYPFIEATKLYVKAKSISLNVLIKLQMNEVLPKPGAISPMRQNWYRIKSYSVFWRQIFAPINQTNLLFHPGPVLPPDGDGSPLLHYSLWRSILDRGMFGGAPSCRKYTEMSWNLGVVPSREELWLGNGPQIQFER